MIGSRFLLLLVFPLLYTLEGAVFSGHVTSEDGIDFVVFSADQESLISMQLGCYQSSDDFLTAYLQDEESKEMIASVSAKCADSEDEMVYQSKQVFSDPNQSADYRIVIIGAEGAFYDVDYTVSQVRLPADGTSTLDTLSPGIPSIHTFMVEDWDTINYRFLDVSVEGWANQSSIVGKMIVTQDQDQLYNFLVSPNTSTSDSLRLSYSVFGRIVLSDVSKPKLGPGLWLVGNVLFDKSVTKNIELSISVNTDYEYVTKIIIVAVVSCLGVILPVFCRYIFNFINASKREVTFEAWRTVVFNWFFKGKKSLAYLTGFLAWMLLVSAFQVVHAKWGEMMEKGDRDICYYNERCYRPYLGYYDVSVNGIASNLPFMVHGAIVIFSVSLSETNCYLKKHHGHYDYSIPYSFGMAFIFEGFGSLLYHICPSQIIFQYDTLFMFVISQYIITALVDGHAIRKQEDATYFRILGAQRKSIRSPKLYLFFLGPAYGFNFVGNLHYISPLPPAISFFYFFFLGIWVICILMWAMYKSDLLPRSYFPPPTLLDEDGEKIEYPMEKREMSKKGKMIGFILYSVLVLTGFVMVVLGKLVISIFILGELIVALIIMTANSFRFMLKDLRESLSNAKKSNSKYHRSFKCLIPFGVIFYLLCGAAITVVSLFFFVILENTNKSLAGWDSRELNKDCIMADFWDAHDLWHFFASHSLMMIILIVMEMQKPCRKCYVIQKGEDEDEAVEDADAKESGEHCSLKEFEVETGDPEPAKEDINDKDE